MGKTVTISAGHSKNPGTTDYGAVGYVHESAVAREITKNVIKYLEEDGIKCYNCTDASTKGNVTSHLKEICDKHNKYDANLAVSIHLNSSLMTKQPLGSEVYYSSGGSKVKAKTAKAVCKELAEEGFKNRGTKVNNNLYFLNHTNDPAILIEAFFVSSKADVDLYNANKKKVAKAIAQGIKEGLK